MKKNSTILIGLIAILVVAVGAYLIFHKSSSYNNTTSTSNSSSQSNGPAVNNAVLKTKTDASIGKYLTDPNGKALYTYNGDTSGVSNCTGSCLVNWPAYVDKGSTSNLPAGVSTVRRADSGQTQYTYNGLPLYYFSGDSQGKVTGNGVDNFSVAKPTTAASSPSSSSSSAPPSSTPSSTPPSSSSSGYPY